jgi:hypothetical protein
MTTPTAKSMTLPLNKNCLNSLSILFLVKRQETPGSH